MGTTRFVYAPDSTYAVGIDLGGTKINAGIVDEKGHVLSACSLPTLPGHGSIPDRIIETLQKLFQNEDGPDLIRIRGIGVASAGQINWGEGSVHFSTDLIPGYTGTPLRRILEERFQMPVFVDNDVNVLTLTEKRLGSAQGLRNFVCLALGTGVGGGIMADGQIVRGSWGGAGEVGHMSVDFDGLPCVCGGMGCLEQYASGTGIGARMRRKLESVGRDTAAVDAREVIALWQAGDVIASTIMNETFRALGSGLASLIHMFNPEMIVLGGGVAESGEVFLERVRAETLKRAMPSFTENLRIVSAYRGNYSGMIGAGLQLWEYPLRTPLTPGEG
ncbi:ROK family protein [Paenibacillus sp. HJL G12]|uniref:ROK family protein n=1 Tax=Paenibacillus dendrobii TaxID=2691084 RepID=A0A7X3INR5_9BACL|nr:ROK family protein [Paenibacillus dendrobii]MWV46050.1 ROK family protein [Paenibacillus dendrobii]